MEKKEEYPSEISIDSENNEKKEGRQYKIDFTVVMDEIGNLGRYQILLVFLAYWVTIPSGINQVASVFLAATPDFRCALPPLDNQSAYGLSEEELGNLTLPINSDTNAYDTCSRYNYDLSSCVPGQLDSCITPYPPVAPEVVPISCDKGYWYDTSVYTSTIITQWNMVCNDQILGAVVSAVFFAGILLSSLIGGNIADRLGRTPTMLVSQIGMAAFGIGCAFSPNLVGFAALRFMVALFLQAGFIACFVYVVEITGEKWQTLIGINVQTMFAVGYISLSGFAYGWRDWRYLQFAISFVPLPFVIFWFFLPESPLWLFSKGKVEKGKEVCEMMARRNGNKLSDDVWERAEKAAIKSDDTEKKSASPLELFRRPKMLLVTINMMFNWFVNSLVYYGLSLNAGELAGDDFLNNTLNGLVEFIAYFIVIVTMDRIGRKPLLSGCLMLGGIACLASTVVNVYKEEDQVLQDLATAFALIGKIGISGSFAIVYNYSAELYPTVIRSTAVGMGSMSARIGSIITPFTLELQYIIPWLTGVIFGVLALVAGLTSLAFPETLGHKMMTTLDEAEAFYAGVEYKENNSSSSGDFDSNEEGKYNEAFRHDETTEF